MRTRSEKKRDQILEGAGEVFEEEGYGGSSMNQIARTAGVSKGTLYNYYDSKRELFVAYMHRRLLDGNEPAFEFDLDRRPEQMLADVAEQYLEVVTSDEAATIYRLVIGEAPRFPELGEAFFEGGPARNFERLADYLKDLDSRDIVDLGDRDASACASIFFAICRSDLFLRELLQLEDAADSDELRRHAERAAEMFLDALR